MESWFYGNMGDMKTTLEIPDPLFRKVKAKAAMEGLKMKDLVASALDAYLTAPQNRKVGKAKRCPFPLVRGKGGPLLKQMNNEIIAKLDEEEDLERYGRSLGR